MTSARLLATTALAAVLGLAARTPAADVRTIAVNIEESTEHTILLAALREGGLLKTLEAAKGSHTLFAPTDEAFRKLGEDTIKAVLADRELLKKVAAAHLVKDRVVYRKDLVDGTDLNGFKVSAGKDGLKIGDAKITSGDLKCSNGVIHVIDAVLIPK